MLLPILVAADFGGVLWWTQYMAALLIVAAAVLAIASLADRSNTGSTRQYRLMWPLVIWAIYGWSQTLPMKPSLVQSLSPASQSAYTDWISPFVAAPSLPQYIPISLASFDSRHAAAMLTLLIALVWATLMVFRTRARIAAFLSVIALGTAAHAAFGIFCVVFPETLVWGVDTGTGAFGTFINRNNAALLMNIGLAASLGLLAWRLTALTGQEVDDPAFEVNDLVSLVSDRESLIGVIGAVICLTGILICGSRGGVVSALAGALLAMGWVRQRRGFMTVPVVGAALALGAAMLIIPLQLNLQSIRSFRIFSSADTSTILRDGRLTHWRDGWEAATAHLPAGSGLATYAYAYLPFQETSSKAWYHHADNLWLEMFTEQGAVGLALAIWILVVLIRTLARMAESVDPIDQGLRVAGWYLLGAILVSQFFDFGLIIPANLFLVVTLYSIIAAREAQTGTDPRRTSAAPLKSRRGAITTAVATALAALALVIAHGRLATDADRETLLRSASTQLDAIRGDSAELTDWITKLRGEIGDQSWPAAHDLLCEFEHRRLRLAEVTAARPVTQEQATQLYQATSPLERRLPWLQKLAAGDSTAIDTADEAYGVILEAAEKSMVALPLGSESRKWQLYLDFAHRDAQRSDTAMTQLTQFYRSNPLMLIRLAAFAGDGGDHQQAVGLLRNALTLAPQLTRAALEMTERWPQVSPTEILYDDSLVWRQAAIYVLGKEDKNQDLLAGCQGRLACETCQTKTERSGCEVLAADVAFELEDYQQSFEHFRIAVRLKPTDANLRYKYITRLKAGGNRSEALEQARIGRDLSPKDDRFDRIIRKMAEEDLQALGKQ